MNYGYNNPSYVNPMARTNYGMQQNYMQPNYAMQQQMVQQQPQPMIPTICYAKMEEAKPYIITNANTSILFIDREKNKALLKSSDNLCSSYSRFFNIEETDENGNPLKKQTQETTPQVDFGQFAKKDELNVFVTITQYNELLSQFNSIKDMLTNIKPKQADNKPLNEDYKQARQNARQSN